jgi:cytochrome c oxidase subunit 3
MDSAVMEASKTRNPMYAGIIAFFFSESFLFSALFFAYYYMKFNSQVWPPQGVNIDLTLAIPLTVILLTSSLVVWAAGKSLERGNILGLILLLSVTALLGAGFMGITVFEWLNSGFTPASHAYGSIFFTLTGFHFMHVFGGTLLLTILMVRSMRGHYSSKSMTGIKIGSYYWHFVDIIWILVFITVFIIK